MPSDRARASYQAMEGLPSRMVIWPNSPSGSARYIRCHLGPRRSPADAFPGRERSTPTDNTRSTTLQ